MSSKAQKIRDEAIEEEPGLMMTPMVDIVFQLLVFFMLACRFKTQEGSLNSNLPKHQGMGTISTSAVSISEMRIKLLWCEPGMNRETTNPERGRTVLKVGQLAFHNVTNKWGETEPDWKALYKLICRMRDNFRPTRSYSSMPVIIDARQQVPFKHVVSVLNECVRAGIKEIKFAAPEISY